MAGASTRHLLGRLAVIEARVAAAVAVRRRTDPDPQDMFRGLYLSDDHVDRMLAQPGPGRSVPPAPDAELLLARVETEADAAGSAGDVVTLRALAAAFRLDAPDVDLLLAAAAPDLDPRFERLYGYLHDDVTRRRASIGLGLELARLAPTDASARGRLDAGARLVAGGLLEVEDIERPFLTRGLRVPDRVTNHLLDGDRPDAQLAAVLRTPPPLECPEGSAIALAVDGGVQLVYCRQPPGEWAGSVVTAGWGPARVPLVVDLAAADRASAADLARSAVREARLVDRLLVLGPVEHLDKPLLRDLVRGTAAVGQPVVLYGADAWDPGSSDDGVLALDLHGLSRQPLRQLWDRVLADHGQPPAGPALSAFRLSPDHIRRAVGAATSSALAAGTPVTTAHLERGARLQNARGLGRLTTRVEPAASWDDLVLAPSTKAALTRLRDRVRLRETVELTWELRRGGGRGEGITALFAGMPGTGKTTAAEVVAGELGFDLYVIELSSVVDKYVGETEKNLERVFAGAEGVNGVLFFDEADALFGKRSEVSDAHDRYANLETSYLLQRMEAFDGLAILSTNFRSNLDPAFTRRLGMIVEFTKPDRVQRRVMWERAFAKVPLASDVDLDFCAASFDITGGDIRNIAVSAAYLAAGLRTSVDMALLVQAVQAEYGKLGRLCLETEFGRYYPLVLGQQGVSAEPPHRG